MRHNVFPRVGLLTLMIAIPAWANSPPQVTAVTAAQRTDGSMLVDIYYDLADADGDACTVWAVVSDNGGVNWQLPAFTFSGHVGSGVTPGVGKHMIWDAGHDMPGRVGSGFKVRVYADDGNGLPGMVPVPGGWFPYQNVGDPSQWVWVDSFLIDKYETTNLLYAQFLNNADLNGFYWDTQMEIDRFGTPGNYGYAIIPGRENYPVRFVNISDAEAFAAWRSNVEGVTYRLPTEHEWEKAAAWDPTDNLYYLYGFHQDSISCSWSNYNNCIGEPTPVGSYDGTGGRQDAKSYYGCYDMSGNVWEWTTGVIGTNRVDRGGGFDNPAENCQCTFRSNYSNRSFNLGFRLVRSLN